MARHCAIEQGAVARPRHPVEDDPGERHRWVVPGEAGDQRRHRGALPARIDDEHDRPSGDPGELGGRASLAVRPGAVEEPHHPFAQDDIGDGFERPNEPGQSCRAHRPGIEIEAGTAACRCVKGRVDIVGAGLRRGDSHPAIAQMPQQR